MCGDLHTNAKGLEIRGWEKYHKQYNYWVLFTMSNVTNIITPLRLHSRDSISDRRGSVGCPSGVRRGFIIHI